MWIGSSQFLVPKCTGVVLCHDQDEDIANTITGANMANLTQRGYCYFLCSVFCKENMFVH